MSLPSDVTTNNLKDFYQAILPYLNVGNGGTSDTPLGQVAFFDDVVAPAGWLIADGTVYNIADYPDLANQYERVHGSKNYWGGNGTTTFAVPNWQGEFLRASGTNSHANQGSGSTVGAHQDATEIPRVWNQTLNDKQYIGSVGLNDNGITIDTTNFDYTKTNAHAGGYSNSEATSRSASDLNALTGGTVRPTNTSLLCCVKAVPSSDIYTYSTTERRVGTWIDGKPLYAIVIDTSEMTITTSGTQILSGVSEIIDYRISRNDSNGTDVILYDGRGSSDNLFLNLRSNNLFVGKTSGSYSYKTPNWVILVYTKPTD